MTAEQAADCMYECLRLASLTDDPQIRNQLTQQAQHWMAVAMPALRAARGQAWPFLYADEHAPWLTDEARFEFDSRAKAPFSHRIGRGEIKQKSPELVYIAPVEF
jgi:hypothetical protein